jgi:hypothetical protein
VKFVVMCGEDFIQILDHHHLPGARRSKRGPRRVDEVNVHARTDATHDFAVLALVLASGPPSQQADRQRRFLACVTSPNP